jgi:hypothetical protein
MVTTTGDQEKGGMKYLEFQEDIREIFEDVEAVTPSRKGDKETRGKVTKVTKDETLRGSNIIRYFTKGVIEEEAAFTPTRSLVTIPIKIAKEVDTLAELSDSGNESKKNEGAA